MQRFRTRVAVLGGGLAGLASLALAQVASAAQVIDVSTVTNTMKGEIESNLPAILVIVGIVLAIGLIIRQVRKHAK